jgi:hypothetical protein
VGALMNECPHGADGSYSVSGEPPHDYNCPYCKVEELLARVKELEQQLDQKDLEMYD